MRRRTTRDQNEPPKSSIFDVKFVAEDNKKVRKYHHITKRRFVRNAQNTQNGPWTATGNVKELKSDPWNEFV